MDDNTPAAPSGPQGTPGDDKPIQDEPAHTGQTDKTAVTDPTLAMNRPEVTDPTLVTDTTAVTVGTVAPDKTAVTDKTAVMAETVAPDRPKVKDRPAAAERPAVPDKPVEGSVSRPTRPRGPNVSAIVLGLIAMVLAWLVIASETMDLTIDWSGKGPGLIVGIGALLVVLGAIGLVRRHDDA